MLTPNDYNIMNKPMLVGLIQELTKQLEIVTEDRDKKANALSEALQREEIYKETIASLNLQIYGPKSEKRTPITTILPDNTFNEAEAVADPSVEEVPIEEIAKAPHKPRIKSKGKRELDLEGLPVEQVICDLKDEQRNCPNCDNDNLRLIGTEVHREIVEIPKQIFIREYTVFVYACDPCDKNNEKATIIKGDFPKPVIPKSGLASASIIANIIFRKFFMGLPLYRQEKEYLLDNIKISRQNMANWMIYVVAVYFLPLFELMHEDLLKAFSIHCDETTMKVLKEPNRPGGRSRNSKSYFWLFRTGRSEPHPIVLFKYSHSRAHNVPEDFLKGFNNYAHVDGYEAYHTIDGIIWVGCNSHVRRKFMDALKLIPPKDRNKNPLTLCEIGLNYIDELFKIEENIREKSYDKVFKERQKQSLPIVDEFFTWIHENIDTVTPASKIGIALTYASNQETFIRRYLEDGRLEISNNRAERDVKYVAIGRRNWLFCDTDVGAEASAILYSFVLTAVENSLDPRKYIELVLNELAQVTPANYTSEILRKYLPYSDYITSQCSKKQQESIITQSM